MSDFSITTPSFRNGNWLKLCIASVADQQGVSLEHHVQDAVSDDGTLDWLPSDPRVTTCVEKDEGMYDAINCGFRRANGEFMAYLNCDEQYLPGALKQVKDEFDRRPDIDVLLTDLVIVDGAGDYICHRRSMVPLAWHIWTRFNVTTCSVFLRRSAVEKYQLYFDTQWKVIGDLFWYKRMLDVGVKFGVLRAYTSTFTETGANLALSELATGEKQRKRACMPRWVGPTRPLALAHHRLRMALSGTFQQPAFDYSIYTLDSPEQRQTKHVTRPTSLWVRP